jgi:Zn-dependent protease with chaperone function
LTPGPPAGASAPKLAASGNPVKPATKPASTPAAPSPVAVTGTQLATAFEGQLERRGVAVGYQLGLAAVAGLMVLLPVVYFGIIAAACWLVWYHATHSVAMFDGVRGRGVIVLGVVYVAPIIAGGLLVLAMILPLFWRSRRGPRPFWVDRREQPLLYAYVDKLCDVMRAPRPARIDIVAAANASAHIDNGVFGLLRRRLVLTLGLPLATTMNLRQFTGVVAHELGHFSQGSSMRLSYVVHNINGWFARMAWGRSGIDDMVDGMLDVEDGHWALALIGLACKCVIGLARLVLMGLAIVSHGLTMNLSRQAEFDADRQAARIVGGEAMGEALQAAPFIDAAFDLAVEQAQSGWVRRRLPDDLVACAHTVYHHLPPPLKDGITSGILTSEASWFDTHPPLYKRVATLKRAGLRGVLKLDAPATVLFKDFDELSKIATIDLYQSILGNLLQPEHLVEVQTVVRPA